jgi:hypothetical protein
MRRHPLASELLSLAAVFLAVTLNTTYLRAATVSGPVTRITSQRDFEVDGTRVTTTAETVISYTRGLAASPGQPDLTVRLGQTVEVSGKFDGKTHSLQATKLKLLLVPDGGTVTGLGIVDLIPPPDPSAPPNTTIVRADGNLIIITPDTAFTSTLPDPSLNGIHTNVWISYHGARNPDGTVLTDRVSIKPNVVAHKEETLNAKWDYKTDEVDPDAKQSVLSKAVKGVDPKQVPPYVDAAMQARVDRIGASLIPAYQRALPDSDPTRIVFRFQLVDQNWKDALTLPSGIILVPHQVVDRLENDSQLATVLADNMACALEKQVLRAIPAAQAMTATDVAGMAAGLVVPGAGAVSLGTYAARSVMARHRLEQSGRVSLTLLSDAGYDIAEAPRAWWLLSSKKPKEIVNIPVPERAEYLYGIIAIAWPPKSATP